MVRDSATAAGLILSPGQARPQPDCQRRDLRTVRHGYNDTTSAFKAYHRYVIDALQPLLSTHFNLTVEMPPKAVVRGYTYAVVAVSWTNRRYGRVKDEAPGDG